MTTIQVKAEAGSGAGAGTQALTLLSGPINVFVLLALADEPRSLVDLRREAGSPPQTTMRYHLRTLTDFGVIAKRRQNDFPSSVSYELTSNGQDLLEVGRVVETWLAEAPDGPLPLGSAAAKGAIKALVEGWSTNLIRVLAARSLSLTELNRVIASLSYPSLERRLAAMRLAGQIEGKKAKSRGTPYAATGWLRRAVAPIAAATRWEGHNESVIATPVSRLDVEAAFLLALPMISLPPELSGTCRLGIDVPGGSAGGPRLAGVMVELEKGRITSRSTRLQGSPDASATGSLAAWLRAVIDDDSGGLEMNGHRVLAAALVEGLHGVLFGLPQRRQDWRSP